MSIKTLHIPFKNSNTFIKQGDTIEEILFNIPELDLTGATIKLQLYKNKVTKVLEISSGNGITITDANNFKIDEIPAADNTMPSGEHTGDLEITLADGTKKTLCNVVFTILNQYTK